MNYSFHSYIWKAPHPKEDGRLFESLLSFDLLKKVIKMRQADLAKDIEEKFKGNLEINKLIYVPKSLEDELSLENLNDSKTPQMVEKDLDLPFNIDKDQYDCQKLVKIRVISKNDWGRVDWNTGEPINKEAKPAHVERIIVNIHGGSWNNGSSGSDLHITSRFTQETECPIFAIDYRLAPDHKFPNGLSDCLQAYLWISYYSEKYLQLTFDEVVIDGDSAGGNLS